MNCFLEYIKDKISLIWVNILVFGFFSISFFLYDLPLQAVIYPYIVCITIEIVFILIDYTKYKNKHHALQILKQNIESTNDSPNVATTLHEQDYNEIITLLIQQRQRMQDEFIFHYNDITQYYTVWAHQIKTPIASMRLSLQSEDTNLARKLSADLCRVEQYVQMVMAYIRVNSITTDYTFNECNLDTLIKQAVKSFRTEFIQKKLSLIYEPITIKIITDEKWFLFVLEQIISNSLKYTQAGYIKIYIDKDNILCIEDSGIGIAPEDLPRIFENGYTGTIGRAEKKASGIGLYLCKTVCDRLNYKISAKSHDSCGTTIMIDLTIM